MWLRIKTVLVFALLGPVVGGLIGCPVFFCAIGAVGSGAEGFVRQLPAALALCTIYGPLFGYFLGFVPAAITGLVLAWQMPVPLKGQLWRAVAIAALVTTLYAVTILGIRAGYDLESWTAQAILAALMLLSGTLSAAVCWKIVAATAGVVAAPPQTAPAAPPPSAPAPPPA